MNSWTPKESYQVRNKRWGEIVSEQLTSLTFQVYPFFENIFIEYLIVLGIVLGTEGIELNKTEKNLCSHRVSF